MKLKYTIVGVLLAFILGSGVYYTLTNSITSDELTHITAGYVNLRLNDYRFNIEHPPLVKQLAALPLLFMKINFPFSIYEASSRPDDIVNIQSAFLFKMGNDLDLILFLSRIPNVLISVLLGLSIYLYSRKLNGFWAGVTSLALFAFSPSFLGHSPLVTMDTTVSCFYFVTIYFLMRFVETKRNLFLTLTGIFLGLALISKFSALVLIPVVYIIILLYVFTRQSSFFTRYRKLISYVFLLPLLPLACSYKASFKFIAPALFAYVFFSIFFKKNTKAAQVRYACAILLIVLTIAFTFIIIDYTDFKWFPSHSATKAYFKGFSSFGGHASGGQGDAYLLGMHSGSGWWYYFPLAILFKEPLAFIVIFILGLWAFFLKREGVMAKALLLVPALTYLLVSMFINKVNIGVRHILPLYPFMYIISGYAVRMASKIKYLKYVIICLVVALAIDVLFAYPGHLSYFNRLFGGTKYGYKLLGDSNLAWGQDWKRLKNYVIENQVGEVAVKAAFTAANNCSYYKIPCKEFTAKELIEPGKGIYVLEATELIPDSLKWAKNISPTHRIGGSLLVYNTMEVDKNR